MTLAFTRRAALLATAACLATPSLAQSPQVLRIGVSAGPHAQIIEAVKPIAAKKGLELKVTEFTDYVVPNQALNAGELDLNSFQHQPYLDNQVKDRGYALVAVAKTVNFPIGIYSTKHKAWSEVPDGATIAIPNDPTNGGRVLLLLKDKGVITLKEGVGLKPTVADITGNPKKLKIVEIDAAQLPRALPDVAAAAINTNYALEAKIDPTSAILREDANGPYANIIVVRSADQDKPWVKSFVEAYHSPEVKAFIMEKFKGSVLTAW